jgi:dethiobiotin synthase
MKGRAFFVAATGQNVGKTTTCLGLFAGLKKRFAKIGFFKPVGQEHVETAGGVHVDKDVVLFKSHFKLRDSYEKMSPVLFPRGFTRDYLDGRVSRESLVSKITQSFAALSKKRNCTIIEGTGHTGVGSIVDLNNAQVASLLKVPLILVASGGLGSAFDELTLNHTQCEKYGVRIAGVILNRVFEEKREMVSAYMSKALQRWNIPLLGLIPYDPFLSTPTMADFELLFHTDLLTGAPFRFRHFRHIRLVASSVEIYRTDTFANQLVITSSDRDDIILATLTRFWDAQISHPGQTLEMGLILTGKRPPKESIVDQIRRASIPMLYLPVSSFVALKMINTYTTKIRKDDREKIEEAVQLVEKHIDFDKLLQSI